MFTRLNRQGVESDSGFTYQRDGRVTAYYSENEKKMLVIVDDRFDGDRYFLAVKATFNHWESPSENDPVDKAKQNEIQQNIGAALTFLEIDHVFE